MKCKKSLYRFITLCAATLALAACGGGEGSSPPPPGAAATVSFSTQVQPIFTANCTINCHSPGGIAGFLNLTTGNSFASLLLSTPPRVIAGSSASSLLYRRITGVVLPQMPLDLPPLSAADQTLIKNWIDQGAANN
jgi:hypothetical protein